MFTLDKIPSKCCGDEIIGASILGGAALIGTGASVATNASNQDYGAAQSAAARAWGTNERIASQQYNTQERLATQEYNNPANQAMMMRAGGLNPSSISQGVRFVGSSPQSSSPGSAGGISPMGTNQVPNIPQLISSGSDLVNALAKHKETEASLPLIGEEVKYYVQKTYGEQLSNDLMAIEKEFKKSTLPSSIKKVHEEVAKLEFEKIAVEKQGKVFEQEEKLKNAQTHLADMQAKLTGEQAIQSHYLTDNWHRITDSMLKLQRAQANEANAGAALKSEQVNTEKSIQNINKFTAEIKEIERNYNQSTFDTRFRQELSKLQAVEINNMLDAIKANDLAAYSAFQRILYGKSQEGDLKKVVNALDNIDNVSWSFNNHLGK